MEEIDYSMLFRWFVGLNLDEDVWDPTTFTKNRRSHATALAFQRRHDLHV